MLYMGYYLYFVKEKRHSCFEKEQRLKCLSDKWRKQLLNNNFKKPAVKKIREKNIINVQSKLDNKTVLKWELCYRSCVATTPFPRVLCLDDAEKSHFGTRQIDRIKWDNCDLLLGLRALSRHEDAYRRPPFAAGCQRRWVKSEISVYFILKLNKQRSFYWNCDSE